MCCTVKIECRVMYWCANFWEWHGKPKHWTSHFLDMAFAKMVTSNKCQLICWSCAGKQLVVICQVPFHRKFQSWANCNFCKSSGLTHYLRSRVGQLALHVLRFPFCTKWELIFCLPVIILWSESWVLTSAWKIESCVKLKSQTVATKDNFFLLHWHLIIMTNPSSYFPSVACVWNYDGHQGFSFLFQFYDIKKFGKCFPETDQMFLNSD